MSTAVEVSDSEGRVPWRQIYQYLERRLQAGLLEIGSVVAHTDLRATIDPSHEDEYYGAVTRATSELQKVFKRDLRSVRGIGYRLTAGDAHLDRGLDQQRKAQRAVRRGQRIIATVDRALMDMEQCRRADAAARAFGILGMVIGAQIERVNQHEEQIAGLFQGQAESRVRQHATEEQLAAMRAELERLRVKVEQS